MRLSAIKIMGVGHIEGGTCIRDENDKYNGNVTHRQLRFQQSGLKAATVPSTVSVAVGDVLDGGTALSL